MDFRKFLKKSNTEKSVQKSKTITENNNNTNPKLFHINTIKSPVIDFALNNSEMDWNKQFFDIDLNTSINMLIYGYIICKYRKKKKKLHECLFYINFENDSMFLQWLGFQKKTFEDMRFNIKHLNFITELPFNTVLPKKYHYSSHFLCLCFTISNKNKWLILKFDNYKEKKFWWQGLQYFALENQKLSIGKIMSVNFLDFCEIYLEKLLTKAQIKGIEILDFDDTKELFEFLHIEINENYLKSIFLKNVFDEDKSLILFETYGKIYSEILNKPEAIDIFSPLVLREYEKDENDSPRLPSVPLNFHDFVHFIKNVQKEFLEEDEILKIFDYFLNNSSKEENQKIKTMNFFVFTTYLFSDFNSLLDPEKIELYQDMTRPLSEYYIFAFQKKLQFINPYLTRDNAIAIIKKGLLDGHRFFELNLKQTADSRIVYKYGDDEFSYVPFEEVLPIIKENCFAQSKYPLLLEIFYDNNFTMINELYTLVNSWIGEYLFSMPIDYEDYSTLLSPEELKGKILIIGKGSIQKQKAKLDRLKSKEGENIDVNTHTNKSDMIEDIEEEEIYLEEKNENMGKFSNPLVLKPTKTLHDSENKSEKSEKMEKVEKMDNYDKYESFSVKDSSDKKKNKPKKLGTNFENLSETDSNSVITPTTSKNMRTQLRKKTNSKKKTTVLTFGHEKSLDFNQMNTVGTLKANVSTSQILPINEKEELQENNTKSFDILEYSNNKVDRRDPKLFTVGFGDPATSSQVSVSVTQEFVTTTTLNLANNNDNLNVSSISETTESKSVKTNKSVPIKYKKSNLFHSLLAFFDCRLSLKKERTVWEMASLNTSKLEKIIEKKEKKFIDYNKRLLSKIHHKDMRTYTSTFQKREMILGMYLGIQIEIFDLRKKNLATLCENSGYIVKPPNYLTEHEIEGKKPKKSKKEFIKKFKFKIISGHQLIEEDSNNIFCVEVMLKCHRKDPDNEKKWKSDCVSSDKYSPIFNLDCSFEVSCVELSFLIIQLFDTTPKKIGWISLPINILREGYRNLDLMNAKMEKIQGMKLFCYNEISVYSRAIQMDDATSSDEEDNDNLNKTIDNQTIFLDDIKTFEEAPKKEKLKSKTQKDQVEEEKKEDL